MSIASGSPTVVGFDASVLDRMVLAVEQVRQRLLRTTAALEAAGIPYAVIGGNAVAAWVSRVDPAAIRNTADVDLLVRREDLEAVKQALEAAGFEYGLTFGVHIFVDGPRGKAREGVHLLFAGEYVRDGDLFPTPTLDDAVPHETFRVVSLESLVTMKLTSFRDKDRAHLRDMLEIGLIDASWLTKLPPEAAARLRQLIENPQG